MRKKNNKTAVMAALLSIVALSMLGLGGIFSQPQNSAQEPAVNQQPTVSTERNATRNLALSCTLDIFTKFHIHPHLQIIINGKNEIVPANVGITADCEHPIHTHDTTGEIHIESPEQRDFTLGDFFAVWGEPFSAGEIFNYKTDASHEILMTVDGKPNSEYENLILRDGEQIAIKYNSSN